MNQKAIVSLGIVGVISSVLLGVLSIIPWQVSGVLVPVFIGVPTLLLHYERGKTKEGISHAKFEEKHAEKENIQLSPPKAEMKEPKAPKGSPLLPDSTEITRLRIDGNFVDKIYEEARNEALNTYDDAQLSYFAIQASPFETEGPMVYIYFDFYSKWANRICRFQYSDLSSKLKHYTPDKHAKKYEGSVFNDLPWKRSPHFLECLNKVYDKIKPLSFVKGTNYILFVEASEEDWSIKFEDGLNGNEYWYDWNGKGLDENSIKAR
jgi:hypothetical protein